MPSLQKHIVDVSTGQGEDGYPSRKTSSVVRAKWNDGVILPILKWNICCWNSSAETTQPNRTVVIRLSPENNQLSRTDIDSKKAWSVVAECATMTRQLGRFKWNGVFFFK